MQRLQPEIASVNCAQNSENMTDATAPKAVVIMLNKSKNRPRYRTVIDEDDYERVMRMNWAPQFGGLSVYAVTSSLKYIPKQHQLLHRYIIRTQHHEIVDHINGDTLDNRKSNLRIVTTAENRQNSRRPTFEGKSSKFKGVTWDARRERWVAQITCEGVTSPLGAFSHEADAARAYDRAAGELFGEYARTNAAMNLYEIDGERAEDLVPNISVALAVQGKAAALLTTKSQKRQRRRELYGSRQYLPDDLKI